jgi:CheY-like chemotaxis protein/signal transduction histidine kinase
VFFVLGRDGQIVHVSASFKAFIGWDASKLMGPLASCPFWPSESAAADISAVTKVLGAGSQPGTPMRLTWMHPSGQRLPVEVAFTPLDIDGLRFGLFCEVLGLREGGDTALWLRELPEGRLVQANAVSATIWAPDRKDLPATPSGLAAIFQNVIPWTGGVPTGGHSARIFRSFRPDGTVRWISEDVVALRDDEGRPRGLLGMATDITDWQAVEVPALGFERRETFGFAAGLLAHDLNNLLSVILHDATALVNGVRDPGDRIRAKRIAAKSRDAAALTWSFLAASRSLHLHPRDCDLREILGPALGRVRGATGLTIGRAASDGRIEPRVRLDPGAMGVAMVDLAFAIRLVSGSGNPCVDLDIRPAQQDDAGVPSAVLRLAVRGCPEVMAAALTWSEDDRWKLRIAAVSGFAQLSGGALRIYVAQLSETTTFELTLPLAVATRDDDAPQGLAVVGQRILLVDDDEDLADAMRETIERAGHVAMCCGSAAAALACLEEMPYDVVVSDISMPGMSGASLLQIVRARWPAVGVVLMTGFSRLSIAGLDQTGTRILRKPVEITDLLAAIAEAAEPTADRMASD